LTPPEAPNPTDSFRPVLGATVFLVLALLAIAALKSSRDLQAARQREKQLAEQIAETRKRSEVLKTRIERLHNDPGLLERLAREELGMVRPNDVVIELPEDSFPSALTSPALAGGDATKRPAEGRIAPEAAAGPSSAMRQKPGTPLTPRASYRPMS